MPEEIKKHFTQKPNPSRDEVESLFPEVKSGTAIRINSGGNTFGGDKAKPPMDNLGYNDSGSASRFFYVAKASKEERNFGLYDFTKKGGGFDGMKVNDGRKTAIRKNIHPT